MTEARGTTRRSFLQGSFLVAAGALNWIGCRISPPLSRSRRRTLEAVVERLIPSDDGPGAREAGVIDYIDRALATRYHARLRKPFRAFCDEVEETARAEWGGAFTDLDESDQDDVLVAMQGSNATFDDVLEFTLEGFLCDPRHGGNRNEVGWNFIGYKPGEPRPGHCGH